MCVLTSNICFFRIQASIFPLKKPAFKKTEKTKESRKFREKNNVQKHLKKKTKKTWTEFHNEL